MIVTITMNPALDKSARIEELRAGGLNRLQDIRHDAGGKGINVSKMISALGGDSVATGFLGGSTGLEIEGMLQDCGIRTDFIKTDHVTRTNLKVSGKDACITEFNEPGVLAEPGKLRELYEKIVSYAAPGAIFVFAGSLPQGAEQGIYRAWISAVKEKGAAVFLDADGEAFRLALDAGPDYIKPNLFEFEQYYGLTGRLPLQAYAELCSKLLEKRIKTVLLSMGVQGALFVSGEGAFYAPGLPVQAVSAVGAGDSMTGAFVYALREGLPLKEAAVLAMAASAGAVMTEGTKPPNRRIVDALIKEVRFERLC